jgi:hypothetical protein
MMDKNVILDNELHSIGVMIASEKRHIGKLGVVFFAFEVFTVVHRTNRDIFLSLGFSR